MIYSKEDIDRAFKIKTTEVKSRTKEGGTSCDDVLQFLYDNPDTIWWMSWELINNTTSKGGFLSHRAPARASDLAIHESLLVEDRKIGRFSAYRLRWENINLVETRLGTSNLSPARQEMPDYQPTCQHGVPTYVNCPNCNET